MKDWHLNFTKIGLQIQFHWDDPNEEITLHHMQIIRLVRQLCQVASLPCKLDACLIGAGHADTLK
jgi:hypothetical protein